MLSVKMNGRFFGYKLQNKVLIKSCINAISSEIFYSFERYIKCILKELPDVIFTIKLFRFLSLF